MQQLEISVSSSGREQMIDITKQIRKFVRKSNNADGRVSIFVPHTTAAVTINENADPSVQNDMIFSLQKLLPVYREFTHLEGNSDAHVKSSIIGVMLDVLFENNELLLGVWQGIYFCEFDGPRRRKVIMRIN